MEHSPVPLFKEARRAGILLHPTSLPDSETFGAAGVAALHFIDWLVAAGIRVWQVLPSGPTHDDGSPYQCLSAHAGEPGMICLRTLSHWGWLDADVDAELKGLSGGDIKPARKQLLRRALKHWMKVAPRQQRNEFEQFIAEQAAWLPDFAMYVVLREMHHHKPWDQWPAGWRDRRGAHFVNAPKKFSDEIQQVYFEQFVFFRQWAAVKRYANERGIALFGDIPIFVAHDSADVWAHRNQFLLNDQGQPTVVAGVPPDYFSATGQRWGNPLFNWNVMLADDFLWWRQRLQTQLQLFDLVRVDHFRGFEAYWEIPATAPTAMEGRWVKAPGTELFASIKSHFGKLPLVAEDLGIITDEVTALRQRFGLPGMRVLHFAFGGDARNPYLPHNHDADSVVYTGTHDNDTTLGWYKSLSDGVKGHVQVYLGMPQEEMPWPLIRAALGSVASLAVVPLQDFLVLGTEHRMNRPGTTSGNWQWRFKWDQVPAGLADRIMGLVRLYGR